MKRRSAGRETIAMRCFVVRCRDETVHHGYRVEAESFEAAAVGFAERWAPAAMDGPDHAVSVLVLDPDCGEQHCFTIELGEASPCD